MTICKFWQQGNCKFGDRCRFEHPARGRSQTNRFDAFNSNSNRTGGGGGSNNAAREKYRLDIDNVEKDLINEVPQWILSSYAPGRDTPEQLFGGYPREQSFEEMRLHYHQAAQSGKEQEALAQAQVLYEDAQKQMQNASRNLNDAIDYIVSAENTHPNRHDICREGTLGAPFDEFLVGRNRGGNAPSAFGGGAPQTSAFGQPSSMGAKPNPFASGSSSAFGQPAAAQGNAFGQPSQMGAKPNPFATASSGPAASGAQANPFGQPSQPSGSAFGQPSQASGSAFGQPSQASGSAFGQGAQTQGSAFGQASQMGQKPNPFATTSNATPFGQPQAQQQSSPFGAASINNTASPFGQQQQQPKPNPFGATPSQGAPAAANPFGATPSQGNTAAANPFGSTPSQGSTAKANPFGSAPSQGTTATANPFASSTPSAPTPAQSNGPAANPFANNAQTQAAQPMQTTSSGQPAGNPFASGGGGGAQNTNNSTTGNGPYPPDSNKQHPDGYMIQDNYGQLSTFKGQRVITKDDKIGANIGGRFVRIWFPNGPPGYNKETELPADAYGEEDMKRWKAFEETGGFADGVMPSVPPPRVMTKWDF